MDNKKMALIVGIILVIIIAGLLLMNLSSNKPGNITNISGCEFNIPEGYTLDNDSSSLDQLVWRSSDLPSQMMAIGDKIPESASAYNRSEMIYSNGNKTITIDVVIDVNDSVTKTNETVFEAGELILTSIPSSSYFVFNVDINQTINGVKGSYRTIGDYVEFTYMDANSKITISAPDVEILKAVMIT